MKKQLLLLILFFSIGFSLNAQFQKKEQDKDINYKENLVPSYELPDALISAEGQIIDTPEKWTNFRRPQILSLFSHLVYGRIPSAPSPIKTTYSILNEDNQYLEGRATRKIIKIQFENKRGEANMHVLVISPNNTLTPVPAFMQLNFDQIDSPKMELDKDHPEKLVNGLPLRQLLEEGFAYISVYQQDLVKHNEVEFKSSIHQLFFKDGQSFPKGDEWGVLAAIGWGGMKALDYLETDNAIDHSKVALIGHSKLGKSTLWAAAQDQRFALAISANSGCGGAALWRRKYGETLAKISIFPHWLCTNARKFIHQEADLPVDQHMLLALMAPRPVYVASAEADQWADPRGEYLSAYHANEVYQLFGKSTLTSSDTPPLNKAIIKNPIGYHIRSGGHYINQYDWDQFIAFAKFHFGK